jgi:hypothetical protein
LAARTGLTKNQLSKAMTWAYERAVNGGIPGLSTAKDLANDFAHGKTHRERVNRLIRRENAKCATSGFITGLGGVLTLPLAIPANIASVLYFQIRMIAAIAHMGGHDLESEHVRTLVFMCLAGSATADALKDIAVAGGNTLAETTFEKLSAETANRINQKVRLRLISKVGRSGVINLGKIVPIVGGVIGATVDALSSNMVGNLARDTFLIFETAEEYVTVHKQTGPIRPPAA